MARKIFVNLPVKDLSKSIEFFTKLGFSFNPQFTDENATCMIISEDSIFAMLITEPFFKTFTTKEIADASKTAEVITCLSAENREEVDQILANVIAGGGTEPKPSQDHGWMYIRNFQDLDGHIWEIAYMDESMIPANPGQ